MLYMYVVLFRQEIEVEQCCAYGQVDQCYEPLDIPQNMDCLATYEPVGQNDEVYEKFPGEA